MNPALAASGSGGLAGAAVVLVNAALQHFFGIVPDPNVVIAEATLITAGFGVGAHYLTRAVPELAPAIDAAAAAETPAPAVKAGATAAMVLAALLLGSSLSACGADQTSVTVTNADGTQTTTTKTDPSKAIAFACGAISIADGDFQALSAPMLASGKLVSADVTKEAGIFAVAQERCKNPTALADPATAAAQMLSDAATIYLLLGAPGL